MGSGRIAGVPDREERMGERDQAERVVGVISDTHGMLRPQALRALQEADDIVHAGDIGSLDILALLGKIGRVYAVRGNMDNGPWADHLPRCEVADIGGTRLYVLHDLGRLDLDPAAAGFRAVITGHTHRPLIEERNGVLYLNPGSAGPRRFNLPTTVARLHLRADGLEAEITELEI
jgi:putative phosphoesterase